MTDAAPDVPGSRAGAPRSTWEEHVDALVGPEGWAHASLLPVEDGDPGRFHALFGRDSLIFALQVLPVRPGVAAATLRALAALQGRVEDAAIDEQPGRILHEHWPVAPRHLVEQGWPVRDGAIRYYGSSDATSWFLVLLAATGDRDLARELEPAWRAAGDWLVRALERGEGLVRSGPRTHPGGLAQQGWRDTSDPQTSHGGGILAPDGTTPPDPLADADSQAVAVAALQALRALDPGRAASWSTLRAGLRRRLSSAFGPETIAIDGTGAAVAGAGSWLGWLLWADALEEEAAGAAADRLVRPDLLTPHGVRTLSGASPVFAPSAYHRGAVWPFDNWICWGGLRAAGRHRDAERVREGVLAALGTLGRPHELYGVDTSGALHPIARSNRVQAWTVGATAAWQHGWDGRPAG